MHIINTVILIERAGNDRAFDEAQPSRSTNRRIARFDLGNPVDRGETSVALVDGR